MNRVIIFLALGIALYGNGVYAQNAMIDSVLIGNQIWMKRNLDVDHFQNGDTIPEIQDNEEWIKAVSEGRPAWCYYENNPEYGQKYGKLYNWPAVKDPRGLAPAGWHIPSKDEFTILLDNYGGIGKTAYDALTERGISKLDIILCGYRRYDGYYDYIGCYTDLWISSENNENSAYCFGLYAGECELYFISGENRYGYSVRCVKSAGR